MCLLVEKQKVILSEEKNLVVGMVKIMNIPSLREAKQLIGDSFRLWNERDPFSISATIAFYTIFSLPGLLIILINTVGYFQDQEIITHQIITQIREMIGIDAAEDVQAMIVRASEAKRTAISSIIGIAALLFGATGVFYHLQLIFNRIWGVKPKVKTKARLLEVLRKRLFSFGLILAVGFLLLVSLVVSALLSAVSGWISESFSLSLNILSKSLDSVVSLTVIAFLFTSIYKLLPDVKIKWKDAWPAGILTAILFVIMKFALGLYFGKGDPGSTYGSAGSIILIMLWVSYVGLVILFGAEFTKVYQAYRHAKLNQQRKG